jgi:hypothetical protein
MIIPITITITMTISITISLTQGRRVISLEKGLNRTALPMNGATFDFVH